jgi:hypothetical protein
MTGGTGPLLLTSALHGGELSASQTGCFTSGEKAPNAHWIEGLVGPRADLDTGEEKNLLPCQESNPSYSAPAHHYTD